MKKLLTSIALSLFILMNVFALRIISLSPEITEIIYALGSQKDLVGRTDYCNYPPEVKEITSVGTLWSPSIEIITSLSPDLVISTSIISPDFLQSMRKFGIKSLSITPTPSIEGTYALIREIGNITSTQVKAEQLIKDIKNRVAILPKTRNPRVYYALSYGEGGDFTATGDTFINTIIETAGGENIAKQAIGWAFSKEAILAAKPEIVIIPDYLDSKAFTKTFPYNFLKVKIVTINEDLINRQGPRMIMAIEALSKVFQE